jgi:Cu(I)/Ag(I) efflux system membrane fusion protein
MGETTSGQSRRIWQWLYQRGKTVTIVLAILIAFIIGYEMNGDGDQAAKQDAESAMQSATQPATQPTARPEPAVEYTCAMHPQVRMPNADDRCPICGMELIPVANDVTHDVTAPISNLTLSPAAAALMDVEVSPVIRAPANVDTRMVGKVEVDETRLSYITAWVPGRIDRLYVDYTGTPISKGDHLAEFYSTELLVAQEELIQALNALDRIGDNATASAKSTQTALLGAAREKLRLWGLLPEQIASIEESRSANDHITLYSPVSGIVVKKHATLGQYLDTGSMVYTIADLSSVWVVLDAYESDLVWLRYGQHVKFTTEAYPGETFTGLISFIDPILDEKRRVVRVRVNALNVDGKLKPGMFAKATAHATVAAGGKVLSPELEGKWVGPMHPEIVKDGPGTCDICDMALVRAEDLGYTTADSGTDPLLVPATAVLRTGKRAIVYLSTGTHDAPSFVGREIVLGPRAGDMFIVNTGLSEGDLVVTQGNFKIDSALQIRARGSMMNPQAGHPDTEGSTSNHSH